MVCHRPARRVSIDRVIVKALLRLFKGNTKVQQQYLPTELFNNEQVAIARMPGGIKGRRSKETFTLDLWDLGGKLPHLWVHHFSGTQGVIFVIDDLSVSFGDS